MHGILDVEGKRTTHDVYRRQPFQAEDRGGIVESAALAIEGGDKICAWLFYCHCAIHPHNRQWVRVGSINY